MVRLRTRRSEISRVRIYSDPLPDTAAVRPRIAVRRRGAQSAAGRAARPNPLIAMPAGSASCSAIPPSRGTTRAPVRAVATGRVLGPRQDARRVERGQRHGLQPRPGGRYGLVTARAVGLGRMGRVRGDRGQRLRVGDRRGRPAAVAVPAGAELGGSAVDVRSPRTSCIAYATATIPRPARHRGGCVPARGDGRPNLRALRRTASTRYVEGGRADGVADAAATRTTRLARLAACSTATAGQLERRCRAAEVLRSAGIDVVVDSPSVGAVWATPRTGSGAGSRGLGYNRSLRNGAARSSTRRAEPGRWRAARHRSALQVRAGVDRPDAQIQVAPFYAAARTRPAGPARASQPDARRRLPVRPDSEGGVHITSRDPDATARRSTPTTTRPRTIARSRWESSAACAACSRPSRSRRTSRTRRPGVACRPTTTSSTPG